jgi:broad specificity phosphatase PhoE
MNADSVFYLIRHAQAEINLVDVIGGRSNHSPLTPRGEEQCIQLGVRLSYMTFNEILCSPSIRTRETMRHSLINNKIQPRFIDDLQELSQGDWEGRPRSDVYVSPVKEIIRKDPWNFTPPRGESQSAVARRFRGVLEKSAQKPGTRLVYTHGGCIKYFLADVGNLDKQNAWYMPIENTSITKVAYNKGIWKIEYHNDYSHLV